MLNFISCGWGGKKTKKKTTTVGQNCTKPDTLRNKTKQKRNKQTNKQTKTKQNKTKKERKTTFLHLLEKKNIYIHTGFEPAFLASGSAIPASVVANH